MIYADTDFILALAKKDDWLKQKAKKIHKLYKGDIVISTTTLTELMLIAEKLDYDPTQLIAFALEIATLAEGDSQDYFLACEYKKRFNLNVFDALHVVKSKGRIISSDKKFSKIPFLEVIKI